MHLVCHFNYSWHILSDKIVLGTKCYIVASIKTLPVNLHSNKKITKTDLHYISLRFKALNHSSHNKHLPTDHFSTTMQSLASMMTQKPFALTIQPKPHCSTPRMYDTLFWSSLTKHQHPPVFNLLNVQGKWRKGHLFLKMYTENIITEKCRCWHQENAVRVASPCLHDQ